MRKFEIIHDLDPSKIPVGAPRGRPRGKGRNQLVLNQLVVDDPRSCLWMVSPKRAQQFLDSAKKSGMRLKVKKVLDPEDRNRPKFIIWRISPIHESPDNKN